MITLGAFLLGIGFILIVKLFQLNPHILEVKVSKRFLFFAGFTFFSFGFFVFYLRFIEFINNIINYLNNH